MREQRTKAQMKRKKKKKTFLTKKRWLKKVLWEWVLQEQAGTGTSQTLILTIYFFNHFFQLKKTPSNFYQLNETITF